MAFAIPVQVRFGNPCALGRPAHISSSDISLEITGTGLWKIRMIRRYGDLYTASFPCLRPRQITPKTDILRY